MGGERARGRRNRSVERSVETRETRTRGGLVAGPARRVLTRATGAAGRWGGRASRRRPSRGGDGVVARSAHTSCQISHPPDPRRSRTRRIVAPDILWRAAHSTRAVSRRRRARTRPGAYRALASPRVIRVARRFSSRASPSVASRGAALGSRNSDWRIRAEPPTHGRPRGRVHGRIVPRRRPSGRRRTRSSLLRGAGARRRRPFRGRSRDPRRGPRRRRREIHRATRPRARRANLRHARRPRPRRLRPRRSDLPLHHPGRRSRRARVPRRRRRDAIPRLRG